MKYKIKHFLNKALLKKQETVFIKEPAKIFHENNIKKILLLRHDRNGDVLVTVPFLRKLRDVLPSAHIDILLSYRNVGVRRAVEDLADNILLFERGRNKLLSLIRTIINNEYDLIIDPFDKASFTASLLVSRSGAKFRLGISKENSFIYTHAVPLKDKWEFHIVERIAELLLPFGIYPPDSGLELSYSITAEEKRAALKKINKTGKIIGINLAGSSKHRYWGTENHISLVSMIKKKYTDPDVVLFHTPDCDDEAAMINRSSGSRSGPASNDFHEYATALSCCDIIITTDTVAVHLASALNIPCIAYFAFVKNSDHGMPWLPYGVRYEAVLCDNLSELEAAEVFASFSHIADQVS